MKNINIILVNIILIFTFCSCEKNMVEEVKIETEKELGVAQFSSKEEFILAVRALEKDGVYPVQLDNITSLATKNKLKSINDNTEEVEDTLINSDLIKEFLNSDYEIIVGNVFFKITEVGVIFSDIEDIDVIRSLAVNNDLITNCSKVTYAHGYNADNGMYKMNNYEGLYIFDSFRKIEPHDELLDKEITSVKSIYTPTDSDFKNIEIRLSDKDWKEMRALSVSDRHYFDRKNRIDVKFYAENILVYFEMGVKTKAQKKGWTGIWTKANVDEVISGWDILNVTERFDKTFFSPDYVINNGLNEPLEESYSPLLNTSFGYEVGYSGLRLAGKSWKIINFAGFNLDFRSYEAIEDLWSIAYNRKRVAGVYENRKYGYNYNWNTDGFWIDVINAYDGIRIIENEKSTRTNLLLSAFKKSEVNTDKSTAVILSELGDIKINFKITGYDTEELKVDKVHLEKLESRLSFNPNSVLYGAIRKGNTWRGVKLTIR